MRSGMDHSSDYFQCINIDPQKSLSYYHRKASMPLTLLILSAAFIYSGFRLIRHKQTIAIQRAFKSENYQLVWPDEFNGNGAPAPKSGPSD
ncbi:hypothetical protein FHW89_002072 [Mucilaginibacter sp. SG564]|nr:hypothetical protein [Mucilaginibacter sp. SG564]